MNRRGLLLGLGAALAMPAIVKAENLMKVAALRESVMPKFELDGWTLLTNPKLYRCYLKAVGEFVVEPVALAA